MAEVEINCQVLLFTLPSWLVGDTRASLHSLTDGALSPRAGGLFSNNGLSVPK